MRRSMEDERAKEEKEEADDEEEDTEEDGDIRGRWGCGEKEGQDDEEGGGREVEDQGEEPIRRKSNRWRRERNRE